MAEIVFDECHRPEGEKSKHRRSWNEEVREAMTARDLENDDAQQDGKRRLVYNPQERNSIQKQFKLSLTCLNITAFNFRTLYVFL